MEYGFWCIFSMLTRIVMKKARYKKIYYIPGAISLLILPILFVVCVNINRKAPFYHVLEVVIRNEAFEKKYPELFAADYPNNGRNYEAINITGVLATDKVKLAYSQIKVREILQQKNLVQGVHFHFGDSSNYWAFVKVLDILKSEKAGFAVDGNNIWFYYRPRDTMRYDCKFDQKNDLLMHCVIYVPKLESKGVWMKIKDAWESSWLLITSFSLFSFVSLRRLKLNATPCRERVLRLPT